jgi:hypothetical protein
MLTTRTTLSGLVRIRTQASDLALRAEIGIPLDRLLAEDVYIFGRSVERRVRRDFRAAPYAELKALSHGMLLLKIRISFFAMPVE